jgi:hypothetical protein
MFGKLASLFVEVEKPTPGAEEPKEEKPAKKAPVAAAPAVPATPVPVPISTASINEEMAQVLTAAIEAANIEGFDYIEFRNALAALASAPLPEPQKFQTVFATAQTMGLTKQKLLDAIDFYQEVLNKKKTEFQEQVQAMVAQEVTLRENLKSRKEQEIADLQEKIRQAQSTIAEKQQEVLVVTTEINEQNLRIQQTASAFEATFASVSGKLQEDKAKIQTYIAN